MFFATVFGVPVLAGLVAGVWRTRAVVPWGIAALCAGVGLAFTIESAFNADGRAGNMFFGVFAGVIGSGLVWIGYALGRISRQSARGLPAPRR